MVAEERDSTDERLLLERDRADESLATRDEFLGMVSHDLRTLLGGIALSASLLAQQADIQTEAKGAIQRHVGRIQRFAARTNRLVGDLLDIVGLEAGGLRSNPAGAGQSPQQCAQV